MTTLPSMPVVTSTSLAAYRTLPEATLLDKVFQAVEAAGAFGLTCDEIADITSIEYRSVTPRIVQLEKRGLVYRAGDCRKGKTGRDQLVVRLTDHITEFPIVRTVRKDGFMRGLMFAARLLVKSSDLSTAKALLKVAIVKKATKA